MMLYFLNYDLRKERDYQILYDELKRFNAVRILESCWCFKRANTNAENMRTYFRQFIDSDDGLIVSQVSDWASINTYGHPKNLK